MAKDIRGELATLMKATLADEQAQHDWTYLAVRPCFVPPSWQPGQKVSGDCSKGVQFLCRWASAPDPMGNSFSLYGNSQTIWLTLQHLPSAADLLVGDIVTFGHDGDEHAAMVLESGLDPVMWGFGHQGAPDSNPLSFDHREKQFLRLPVPKYVPTPEDKLRAKTGYFSWVAWKLGEGDWKHYGDANPTVRPDVPSVIPPSWWKRYVTFLANRKKGNKSNP